ncbi:MULTISPECIES: ExeM/NucH family extracellular endonuclease [unclassified Modicisalibacter]|uniref:ExeM/NucH family extracellular endonuclease n=1 Tax=unclassified Modicisalibacter TaxID=2679913 RepID=UPI001CCC3FC2|nr:MULTISPECIES: ExeM/NucH family extracellular endonuclease [unclassified Modicisalibacter]MBZ9557105.1 ExeM/NucH family extracellular endonuclease [Modicisalibacter sp. R2A 31.J]MBZ9574181.1 ExeM/NucH family extracellular endonuclease [Modicisalibacter sp. MOD 31.J]
MSLFSLTSPYRFHDDATTATFGGASWHGQWLIDDLFERVERFLDDLFDWWHGTPGETPAEPAAPTIHLAETATQRLPLTDDGGEIRGVVGDPTDPALTEGIALEIADADTARRDLTVSVASSDPSVARAALDDDDVLRIAPVSAGEATITVTVDDGEQETRYTLDYAAADGTATNNAARFHTGASDTSAAIAIGDGLILVGDDEDQTLRLYDHDRSGAPLERFDLDAALGLEDGDEVDIESVVDAGNATYYWLGSLSNGERSMVFGTRITGHDADSLQVEVTGQFSGLDEAVMGWAADHRPALDFDDFEVEGSAYRDGTLYLGLRAPIDSDGRALVLPVTNVDALMAAGSADEARFGEALGLDLGGRTIRDIKAVGDGTWLVSAGPANPGDQDGDDGNDDFQLYRWDGAHKAARVAGVDLDTNAEATGGTAETLSDIEVHADGSVSVDVDYDNGTTDWSDTGTESKDLDDAIQTFTSSTISIDALPSLAPQAGDIAFTALDESDASFGFVALEAITPGAVLVFESADGRVTWTAPQKGVAAGSVIDTTTHADQFDGAFTLSLADGVTVRDADGAPLYRVGNSADNAADLTLPPDSVSGHYSGATAGTAEALRQELSNAAAWQAGDAPDGNPDFSVATGHAPLGDPEARDLGIAVSEIWPGQAGSDVTEDWFEITNTGDSTIDFGRTPLYYDDDSADPEDAVQVQGLTTLAPGATAIVMVDGDAAAADEFRQAWRSDTDLDGVEIGHTGSAAGLGGGGDQVTLWLGEPGRATLAATEAYPDTRQSDAASWDVANQRFTTRDAGGVTSDALGGDDDATPALATPGRLVGSDTPPATSDVTLISQVQGTGMVSPLEGRQVTLDAIVTLDAQDGLDGFFIQEEDADRDADAQTAEGLFVYAPNADDVALGDRVRLSGTVTQYQGKTELSDVGDLQVQARDQALPSITEVTLPIADKSTLAAFEGMRVAITGEDTSPLSVTDTYELGRYGSVTLSSGGRLEQYTEHHAPDQAGYQQWLDDSDSRSIVLDDASNVQNPAEVIFARHGEPLSAENTLRGGDTLDRATGVLDFAHQQWRLQSSEGQDFRPSNARPETPDADALGEATLKVASFNVLNYFTTLDENGNSVTTPAGTEHDPRGADSALELTRQQAKIVDAINASDADVVGLMEIENDGYGDESAIAHLVDALDAADPAAEWRYVTPKDADGDIAAPGGDAIAVGLIYKADSVTPAGNAAGYDGDFAEGSRVPILQTFRDNATGETVSVAVNHFKSKGSVIDGQDAIGDGQGNNNPARVEAAEQLAEWVVSDPTDSGDSDVLLIGDFNSYASEDPITTLEDDGFTLLDDDYSYSYDGQWGSLDHALASASLADQVTGTTTWHINADEPTVLDYNTEYKSDAQVASFYDDGPYRASDHDPVVVGLDLGGSAETATMIG